ncbi:MAG: hypothetical protein AAFM91_08305 [Pseudomonadota bacterium]
MNFGGIAFVVIIVAFIGFEMHAASRNSYRMEPEHVFGQFASADRAVSECKTPQLDRLAKFKRNYGYARNRAYAALAAKNPEASPQEVDDMVTVAQQVVHREVDALIAEKGCEDIEVWKLLKRFENLARLNLPIAD